MRNSTLLLAVSLALGLASTACHSHGRAERAGRHVDNAVDRAHDEADDVGDRIERKTDRAHDKIDRAVDELKK